MIRVWRRSGRDERETEREREREDLIGICELENVVATLEIVKGKERMALGRAVLWLLLVGAMVLSWTTTPIDATKHTNNWVVLVCTSRYW